MPDMTWTHPALPRILDAIPEGARTLLDAGCGTGVVGALCRVYREPTRLVGIEIHEPYLARCRRMGFYDEYLHRSLEELPLPFGEHEFDAATCIEVIEHLPRESGERLLDELERVARRVVVSTPNWFFQQDEYDQNPHQRHRSAWSARDFKRRGYRVEGVGGMKILGRHVRYLSDALGPVTRVVPELSTLVLAVRDATPTD